MKSVKKERGRAFEITEDWSGGMILSKAMETQRPQVYHYRSEHRASRVERQRHI